MASAADDQPDFASTINFTTQYAASSSSHQNDDDDDNVFGSQTSGALSLGTTAALDDAMDPFSATERFLIEHDDVEAAGEEEPQSYQPQSQQQWTDEEAKQNNDILQSSVLTPQDYIPKQLVGHTYGDKDWQLKRSPNPLLENHVYQRVGGNAVFSCKPGVLRFAGYQIGHRYSQQLSLVNVSRSSQRVHILPPAPDSGFTIFYNKKGSVAPGMAEVITVTFEPTDWRYYHDAIRVHSLGENLIVPIHAYPTLNMQQHVFPSHVEMGRCCVGGRVSKRIELKCDVPVQFEFELAVLNPTLDFAIFPTRGIVPANGSTFVTIDYTPKRSVTSTISVRVNLSQFDFRPFVSTFTGHGFVQQLNTPIVDAAFAAKQRAAKQVAAKKALSLNAHAPRIGGATKKPATASAAAGR